MASSRAPSAAIARLVLTAIRMRPCTFTVDHTAVTARRGGSQGTARTLGPYTGALVPPGSSALPTRTVVTAGVQLADASWRLLAPANAGRAFGRGANSVDYVNAVGYGRFRVRGVRPVGAILPALAWVVGLDREA